MRKITLLTTILLSLFIITPACAQKDIGVKPVIDKSVKLDKKPIIGVSATAYESSAGAPITYINAIKRAGGVPLLISMTTDENEILNVLAIIYGLVMTGCEGVFPSYYGEEPLRSCG